MRELLADQDFQRSIAWWIGLVLLLAQFFAVYAFAIPFQWPFFWLGVLFMFGPRVVLAGAQALARGVSITIAQRGADADRSKNGNGDDV